MVEVKLLKQPSLQAAQCFLYLQIYPPKLSMFCRQIDRIMESFGNGIYLFDFFLEVEKTCS